MYLVQQVSFYFNLCILSHFCNYFFAFILLFFYLGKFVGRSNPISALPKFGAEFERHYGLDAVYLFRFIIGCIRVQMRQKRF